MVRKRAVPSVAKALTQKVPARMLVIVMPAWTADRKRPGSSFKRTAKAAAVV
jgi:hypothetical protein